MAEQQIDARPRREALQRVQIGLIGLGAVLLVVAFANIVAKTMRPDGGALIATGTGQPSSPAQANGTGADSEPFADLGVTPAPVAPSVPDLEPDPRLRKPMDQDPKSQRQQSGQQR